MINGGVVSVRPVVLRAQIDHGRDASGELLEPFGAREQESRLLNESVCYQSSVAIAGILRRRPAEFSQHGVPIATEQKTTLRALIP